MTRTYTITLEFDVKMTSKGSPARGPSFYSGGSAGSPPEFEIETISFEGVGPSFEALYAKYKASQPNPLPDWLKTISYDEFLANQLYDKVHELAAEDDWSDDLDDYDPPDRD